MGIQTKQFQQPRAASSPTNQKLRPGISWTAAKRYYDKRKIEQNKQGGNRIHKISGPGKQPARNPAAGPSLSPLIHTPLIHVPPFTPLPPTPSHSSSPLYIPPAITPISSAPALLEVPPSSQSVLPTLSPGGRGPPVPSRSSSSVVPPRAQPGTGPDISGPFP